MLHRTGFHLSGKVVIWNWDNNTAKVTGGTVSIFLSRLAYCMLHLVDKHCVTLIPEYISSHLNVGADYSLWGWLVPEWYLLFSHSSISISAVGSIRCRSVGILAYQSMSALLHLGYLWEPLGWMLSTILTYQVSYVFSSPALLPLVLSKCLGEDVTGQVWLLILVACCLMEVPWLPTAPNILENNPCWYFIIKDQ